MKGLLTKGRAYLCSLWPINDNHPNDLEISLLDVKALYDRAYEDRKRAKAYLKRFNCQLSQAKQLDQRYRSQLKTTSANNSGGIA